jgi:hypothetical protein
MHSAYRYQLPRPITKVNAVSIDSQTGVREIESTLRSAQKSGDNMDAVIRQEYLAMSNPADRQAALAQIKQDRKADPSLPGLEITDRNDGDVSVKSDTTRSWATWGKEVMNDAEAAFRGNVSKGQDDVNSAKHAGDTFHQWRLLVPGQQ